MIYAHLLNKPGPAVKNPVGKWEKMIFGIVFASLMVVILGYGVYETQELPLLAQIFPYWIGLIGLSLALIQLAIEIRNYLLRIEEVHADFVDITPERNMPPEAVYRGGLRYFTWIAGLYVGIWLVRFVIAMTGFIFGFLHFEAKLRWHTGLLLAAFEPYSSSESRGS